VLGAYAHRIGQSRRGADWSSLQKLMRLGFRRNALRLLHRSQRSVEHISSQIPLAEDSDAADHGKSYRSFIGARIGDYSREGGV
jgi:hypothetical protein